MLSPAAKRNIIIALVVCAAGGGYYEYQRSAAATAAETRYVISAVSKGAVISTATGSGQVTADDSVDVKAKASGEITSVYVAQGDKVKAGQVLARIDQTAAAQAVRDAQNSLESAQLSLDKLSQPADALSELQAQNALAAAQEARTKAGTDLETDYQNGYADVSNAYLQLPSIMTGLQDLLYNNDFSNGSQANIDAYVDAANKYDTAALAYGQSASSTYAAARAAYDASSAHYKTSSQTSSDADIQVLLDETYATSKAVAEAVKSATDLVQFYRDQLTVRNLKPNPVSQTHITSLMSYTATVNAQISALLAASQAITNDKSAIVTADRTVAEKQGALDKLQAGADPLDIRSQELAVAQRESALADAQAKLDDYSVRAPFDGIVSAVALKKGDNASSGTTVATVLTAQQVATITLNEIDAARVKTGMKTTLTFDAVDGLSITGKVATIDLAGTVSQGVVNYGVRISFDTQDDRVKPGMTVTAAIITDIRTDALAVPNSAIKSQGGITYVETLPGVTAATAASGLASSAAPQRVEITTGLVGDDATEVLTGLTEGQLIITRTIAPSATGAAASTQTRSILGGGNAGFRAAGGGGFGGR